MLRKIGIGCGGLLAVLVLLVIVDALIGSKPAQDAAQKGFDEGFKAASGDSSSSSSQSSETTQSKAQNKGGESTATVRNGNTWRTLQRQLWLHQRGQYERGRRNP